MPSRIILSCLLVPARRFALVALSAALVCASVLTPSESRADSVRDFMVSCSYGALAGTLVGAAMLAFSDKPGDNLNKVARGASLGLYTGMLLGAYVVFGGPSEEIPPGYVLQKHSPAKIAQSRFAFFVAPSLSDARESYGKVDGASAQLTFRAF